MSIINFSILGFGHIGKVHLSAIQKVSDAKLISIIDPIFIENFNFPQFNSVEDFVKNDKESDVIIVASPNGLHAKHAVVLMNAGYHVLIEKPLALSVIQAQEIIETEKTTGKRAFNTLQLRFSPIIKFIKELIENESLGQLFMVNVQCYWNRNRDYYLSKKWHGTKEMDGGVLFTQFSHFADILNHLFGELTVQNAQSYNFTHLDCTDFADSGKVDFISDKIQSGHLIYTTSTYPKNFESSITILAEKGTIQIGGQYMNQLNYFEVENVEKPELEQENKFFHQFAIQEVCSAINEKRASILDARNSLSVVDFIETATNFRSEF